MADIAMDQEGLDTFQPNILGATEDASAGEVDDAKSIQEPPVPAQSQQSSLTSIRNQESSMISTVPPQMSAHSFIHMQQCLKKFDPYLPTNQFSKFTFNQGKPLALFKGQHQELNRGEEAPQ